MRPYTIYNGSKLLLLEIPSLRIKVIDSFSFISAPLSSFSKTFNLGAETKKGFFPHLFNTPENQSYVGSIPDKKFYCCDTMKKEPRNEFLKWYNERVQENYVFDLAKELYEYCDSDVNLLRRGCLAFRNEFLAISNVDPF